MVSILHKIKENYKFSWLGNILRRKEKKAVNLVKGMYIEGKSGGERLKKMWTGVSERGYEKSS